MFINDKKGTHALVKLLTSQGRVPFDIDIKSDHLLSPRAVLVVSH